MKLLTLLIFFILLERNKQLPPLDLEEDFKNPPATKELKTERNRLEIRVANQCTNRLIGNERFLALGSYDKTNVSMPAWLIKNEQKFFAKI